MRKVLEKTEATGSVFKLYGGVQALILDSHAGGVWGLQIRGPNEWINVSDMTFDANGVKMFHAVPGAEYRIAGGTKGAEAVVSGAYF